MTQDTLKKAQALMKKIENAAGHITTLNVMKTMLSAKPDSLELKTDAVVDPVPKGIAVSVINTVIAKYTNIQNNAQAEFDNL